MSNSPGAVGASGAASQQGLASSPRKGVRDGSAAQKPRSLATDVRKRWQVEQVTAAREQRQQRKASA